MDALFIHISDPLAVKIFSFYKRKKDHPKLPMAKVKRKIDPKFRYVLETIPGKILSEAKDCFLLFVIIEFHMIPWFIFYAYSN